MLKQRKFLPRSFQQMVWMQTPISIMQTFPGVTFGFVARSQLVWKIAHGEWQMSEPEEWWSRENMKMRFVLTILPFLLFLGIAGMSIGSALTRWFKLSQIKPALCLVECRSADDSESTRVWFSTLSTRISTFEMYPGREASSEVQGEFKISFPLLCKGV